MTKTTIFAVTGYNSEAMARLAMLEPKIAKFGAVILSRDATTAVIEVPQTTEILLGMFLSEKDFRVRA